jgi:hypothetical protein
MGDYTSLSPYIQRCICVYVLYIHIHTHTHIFTLTGGQKLKSSKAIPGATVITEIRDRKSTTFKLRAEFELLTPLSESVLDLSFNKCTANRYITKHITKSKLRD